MLRSAYAYRPADLARALRTFAGLPTVTVEDEAIVAVALDLAEEGMDFADALYLGRSAHCERFASFDRELVKRRRSLAMRTPAKHSSGGR